MLDIIYLLIGLALLVKGSDIFVDAASEIAKRFGVSEMIIGLTLVAFATSLPEWAAGLIAALRDDPELLKALAIKGETTTDLALGNVIGSNITNIGLVLGVCGLIVKGGLKVKSDFLQREIPLLIILSCLTWFFSLKDDGLNSGEGTILFGIFIVVLFKTLKSISKEKIDETPNSEEDSDAEEAMADASNFKLTVFTIGGLVALLIGSTLLVEGASNIAISIGIKERIVGLTMVAFGTSVPELATSITAAKRGKHAMLLGGVLGSNAANLAVVLGTIAMLVPVNVDPSLIEFQFPVMLGFLFALWIFMLGGKITRWQSGLFLIGYLAFTASLFIPQFGV